MASIRSIIVGTPLALRAKKTSSSGVNPNLQELNSGLVTDSRGKQRLHGAFHGGFSAGYFNTVGSIAGFQPKSFVSSRSDKSKKKRARPEDFMDAEDLEEFAQAGRNVRARNSFSALGSTEAELSQKQAEIAPGIGVVAVDRSAGTRLLLRMGWRRGQCIGKGRKQRDDGDDDDAAEREKVKRAMASRATGSVFGLGYERDRDGPSTLLALETSQRASSSSRQGLSALEDAEDAYDDVYQRDSLHDYDTTIGTEPDQRSRYAAKSQTSSRSRLQKCSDGSLCQAGFVLGPIVMEKVLHTKLVVPPSFVATHCFESDEFDFESSLSRWRPQLLALKQRLTRGERAQALGETLLPSAPTIAEKSVYELISDEDKRRLKDSLANSFTVGSTIGADGKVQKVQASVSAALPSAPAGPARPTDFDSAARLKMFGRMTREVEDWRPARLLCKRLHVPDPFKGLPETTPAPRLTSAHRFQQLLASMGQHAAMEPRQPPPQQQQQQPPPPPISGRQEQEQEEEEEQQPVQEPPEKPPVDLFKAIFEDDDSDEEDDDEPTFAQPQSSPPSRPPPPPPSHSAAPTPPPPPPPSQSAAPRPHPPPSPPSQSAAPPPPPPPPSHPPPPPPPPSHPPPPSPPPQAAATLVIPMEAPRRDVRVFGPQPRLAEARCATQVPAPAVAAIAATSFLDEHFSNVKPDSKGERRRERSRSRSRSRSRRSRRDDVKSNSSSRKEKKSQKKMKKKKKHASSDKEEQRRKHKGRDTRESGDERMIRKLARKLRKQHDKER